MLHRSKHAHCHSQDVGNLTRTVKGRKEKQRDRHSTVSILAALPFPRDPVFSYSRSRDGFILCLLLLNVFIMPEISWFFFILYSFTPPTLTEGLLGSGVGTRFGGVKEKMTQSWPPEVCHLVATQTHQTLVTWQVDLRELGVVSPARGHLRLPRGCQWVGWGLRKQSFELRLGKNL